MNRIDPALFSDAFTSWVRETWPDLPDHVAIDGKTARRSHNRAAGTAPLHLVSAFATTSRLVLGQEAVAAKTSEITAIPLLLERLAAGTRPMAIGRPSLLRGDKLVAAGEGVEIVRALRADTLRRRWAGPVGMGLMSFCPMGLSARRTTAIHSLGVTLGLSTVNAKEVYAALDWLHKQRFARKPRNNRPGDRRHSQDAGGGRHRLVARGAPGSLRRC
jgi:hypothetical protein